MGGTTSIHRDINNFENNLASHYIPLPSSVQYDGFFNSYFFPCEKVININTKPKEQTPLVDSNISFTIEKNIFYENQEDIYISILLNSIKDGSKQISKSLDLVVALDISGSMSGYLPQESKETIMISCLELAKKSIKSLNEKFLLVSQNENTKIKHRLGLCVFNTEAKKIFDLTFAKDLTKLDDLLLPIKCIGGTNLHSGLKEAYDIIKADFRAEGEKKILFMTDMNDNQDSKFFQLLKEISNDGISVDIIGIGQNLNLTYAEKVVNIKDVSLHSAFKQEEMHKILVEDFELNFFPVAKDLKIDFYSNNLKILKTYGTGYKNVKSENLSDNEENELLKNQLKAYQSYLNNFVLLRKYFRKRYKRVPMHVLQTIGNFLKFTKKDVAEFEKLYPSEIKQDTNLNPITGEKDTVKSVKGNMILLKAKIEDLGLHEKLNKREFAEIVLSYVNCDNERLEKIFIPIYFDFNKASSNNIHNPIKSVNNTQNIKEVFPESNAINMGVCLLYCAKFMRIIMKDYHKDAERQRKSEQVKKKEEHKKEKVSFNNINTSLSELFEKKLNSESGSKIKTNLKDKIKSLIDIVEKSKIKTP